MSQQRTVTLASETDSLGFRREARSLLAALVAPEDVQWLTETPTARELFARGINGAAARAVQRAGASNLLLPRSFLSLCETVILHKAARRFDLLYRLLWRAVHEPDLLRNPLDADRVQALHMAQAVRRDMQKIKTTVRFVPMPDEHGATPLLLAWFEPDHHIVEAVAPFFLRRLARQRWALLTPERSLRSDGESLELAPGAGLALGAAESSWCDGYRKVFGDRPIRSDRGSEPETSFRPGWAS